MGGEEDPAADSATCEAVELSSRAARKHDPCPQRAHETGNEKVDDRGEKTRCPGERMSLR
jgi:hypothetical protein